MKNKSLFVAIIVSCVMATAVWVLANHVFGCGDVFCATDFATFAFWLFVASRAFCIGAGKQPFPMLYGWLNSFASLSPQEYAEAVAAKNKKAAAEAAKAASEEPSKETHEDPPQQEEPHEMPFEVLP